jgi:hypothetical protein
MPRAKPSDQLQPFCSARSKRSGEQCRNRAVVGTHVCRMHGAKQSLTKRGENNPRFKDGSRAKYKGFDLAGENYLRALNDPDSMTNKHEIALLESIIQSSGDDLRDVMEPKLWSRIDDACAAFRAALAEKSAPKQMAAFLEIERITRVGLDASSRIKSLREMFIERSRLVMDQHRIEYTQGRGMSDEQVVGLIMTLSDVINRKVSSVEDRDSVQAELMRILGTPREELVA